ncbi:MAG TPA: YetF domain-containing protein [Puia sp.]|jgi:uncharacterized membrane protein YcaP (DUF421 family)
MELITQIFGEGKDLNPLQMAARAIVIFFIALLLIRLSGRRSFGLHTPLDNIIAIMLGAILSRAVVGASDFLGVILTCTVVVLLHRILSWLTIRNKKLSRLIEGRRILVFSDGNFIRGNMEKALVCKEDILEGVRKTALTDQLDQIREIYIERNGDVTSIKKVS